MKKIIITGSTGMVGKGALLACIGHEQISEILLINRSPVDVKDPKIKELLLDDFTRINTLKDQLKGYDACFFCMGVSAFRMSEQQYTKITYDTTKAFADTLVELNPDMTFIYVSGVGTDSSEKGRSMWARVKGRTENRIFQTGFKDAYAFRPGTILPENGIKSKTSLYNTFYVILRPLFPLMRKSKHVTTTSRLGEAMINCVLHPQDKKTLYNPDINTLAETAS